MYTAFFVFRGGQRGKCLIVKLALSVLYNQFIEQSKHLKNIEFYSFTDVSFRSQM